MRAGRKWLVTGAAGFIGSNLCAYLMKRGERVVGYDSFLTGKRSNIDRLETVGGSSFTFVEGDIRDQAGLKSALSGVGQVVHLAAQVSVQRSIDDPAETNDINVTGFLSTLMTVAASGVGRFLYASSCAVYGDNCSLPLSEGATPNPLSPYAASKLINEHYAGSLKPRLSSMTTMGLRFFNIFGPFQDHNGGYAAVIPRWISLMMEGNRPIVFGDGSATRDFCFVDNICEMIYSVVVHSGPQSHAVYNIGTGQAVTLRQLYDVIRDRLAVRGISNSFTTAESRPWREGDIVHSYADIARARMDLGYVPSVTLADGIDRILDQEYGLAPR